MGNSTSSQPNKKKEPTYPDCECLKDARSYNIERMKCLSLDGHYCICEIQSLFINKPNCNYCLAKKHGCICKQDGPNNCKSNRKNHPCTCRDNWRNIKKKNHIGHCKAAEGHPCFCAHDKTKCQACY